MRGRDEAFRVDPDPISLTGQLTKETRIAMKWSRTHPYARAALIGATAIALIAGVAACSSSGSGSSGSGTSAPAGAASSAADKSPITIGVSDVTSGANAYVGTDILNGLKLGIDQVNATGGVLGGRQLKLDVVDDGCDPGTAVTAIKKLISDKVPAIFGPGCSGAALAEMPQVKTAQIPMLVSDASNAMISAQSGVGGNTYTWRINAFDSVIASGFSKYIGTKVKSVYAIGENDDFGRGGVANYQTTLPDNGVKVLGTQYYTPGLASFDPIISKVQAAHPDGLLLVMEPKDAATLIRQLHGTSLANIPVFGRGFISSEFTTALGNASLANGLVGADFWAVGMEPAFDSAYKAAYNTDPPPDSAGPYNAALVMAKAIDLGGAATPAAIEKGLGMVDMTLGWGPVKFDDHNQAHPNVVLEQVVDGTVKILSTSPS
jgi:branched-chain amino acid transport system substrate-binding protein